MLGKGCLAGPFTFAPGDTQEVVFAEMIGQGSDYLHSIYEVKNKLYYYANEAYKNKSAFPKTIAPAFTLSNSNNTIQIQWDNKAESDSFYEGYNVYQLVSPFDRKENSKLIATFDKKDGIKAIYGLGVDGPEIQQYGTDSGVQNNFMPTKDFINNSTFLKGKDYYYAVTAYTYIPGNPYWSNTESYIQSKTISFNSSLPGPNYGDTVQVQHIKGQSDAKITATVIDATKLTGHQYSVSFHDEKYIMGSNGMWIDITSPNKKLGKVSDLTGSSLTSNAIWSGQKGKAQLHYLVNVVSPGYDYCDGIILNLPVNIIIDSIYNPISNSDGSEIPYKYNSTTNTIFFGDSSRSKFGTFSGGEDIVLLIFAPNLPLITNYTMFDDDLQGSIKDVNSSDTLYTIANQYVTQHQWNVTDVTTGNVALKNQTIYSSIDIYAPQDYFAANNIYGPGGSSGSQIGYVGVEANPTFDGVRVAVDGSFGSPNTFNQNNIVVNGNTVHYISSGDPEYVSGGFDISDFIIFGYPDATAATTLPLYGGFGGTSSIEMLQQDYELKWTGVIGDTTINGHTLVITKSGGSYATIFGASNYNLADHPLNPIPGSSNPFLIRIPFEAWNTTTSQQINLLIWDRNYSQGNDPTTDGFRVWNTEDRVYTWAVNTPYSATGLDPISQTVVDNATWNWIFFKSEFNTGDYIKFTYANPLQIGEDTFTFTVPYGIVNVSDENKNVIKEFSLSQNFPNPFNPTTTIEYKIPKSTIVKICVYDILGREVETLVNEQKTAGNYRVEFNASKLASGVYFYRMQAGNFIETKKLLLIK